MEYITPEVEMIGIGSDLIQAFFGPHTDGGSSVQSLMSMSAALEED
jgi:hypothetical protein